MSELLEKLHTGELPGVIVMLSTCLTVATVFAAVQWRKVRVADHEAALKMEMLRQGMSADEIVRVLTASQHGGKARVRETVTHAR